MRIEYVLSFFSTVFAICLSFLTFCVGAFVAFVGYQQYRISRERFKLDLFEKRFSVYKGVHVFLSHILHKAGGGIEQLFQFRADTQDSIFLFDKDVADYINLIDKKSFELRCLSEELEGIPVGEERTQKSKKKWQLLEWLTGQLPKLKDVFAPYLKFESWK